MAIIGKREGWRLSPFLLVFLAFDALFQRPSSSRSAVSPFNTEATIWLPVSDLPRARGRVAAARGLWGRDFPEACIWHYMFRVEKRSAQFFCAYPFAGASDLKRLPFACRSILLSLLSSGFCGKNTFYNLSFVQFHRKCYKIGPGILPTPYKDWTGLAVQVPVHDYKHSKGTLLVTMLPELHLYLILYVPHYKTIHIWPQHN